MLIAKVNGQTVVEVGDYRDLFPNTSFPSTGISDAWLAENSCMGVTVFKPYDSNTQKLVPATPYIESNTVYTVNVAPLSPEDIAAKHASQAAQNKTTAEQLLAQTDWTQVADVPLLNKSDFTAYRATVRAIALNPTHDAVFPALPAEQWTEGFTFSTVNSTSGSTITL